jgi:hypothetical protein
MFGHECKIYFPKNPKPLDEFVCMCTAKYVCVRTFPWAKWNYLGRETVAEKHLRETEAKNV